MKQKGKVWTDAKGVEIPTYAISQVLQLEEKHCNKIAELSLKAEKYLKETVSAMQLAYIEIYEAKLAEAKMKGTKGNSAAMTIRSFNEQIEVQVTKPSSLSFDKTTMSFIKDKITEYLDGLQSGTEMALFFKNLLGDLLQKSGGDIDQTKLSKLRKHVAEIRNKPELAKKAQPLIDAVELFDKASRTKTGNTGLYVSVEENGEMRRVALKYTDVQLRVNS